MNHAGGKLTEEPIQVISAEDEKIKRIGNMLFTDSSRNILRLLLEEEMAAGQVAQRSEMPISLVLYHLQNLQQAGLVRVTRTAKSSKGHEVKYYGPTNLVVVIFPKKAGKRAKRILGSLGRTRRIAAIMLAGISSAILSQNIPYQPMHGAAIDTWHIPVSIVMPLLVLCSGLIIECAISRIKR